MGAWGYTSYDNDDCMDILDPEGEEEVLTEQQAKKVIDLACKELSWKNETFLGLVVYVAMAGHKISKETLNDALNIAQDLSNDKEYLEDWDSPTKRKMYLGIEIEALGQSLIKHFLVKQ